MKMKEIKYNIKAALFRLKNSAVKVASGVLIVVTMPFASSCGNENEAVSPRQNVKNYKEATFDWEKFACVHNEANPAFVDLENQINRIIQEDGNVNRVIIKTINDERTMDLTAHEWCFGVRGGFQDLQNKYSQSNHPVAVKVNDTVMAPDTKLPVTAIKNVGISAEDAHILKNIIGLVVIEQQKQQ